MMDRARTNAANQVEIVFKNGEKSTFPVEEFDVDVNELHSAPGVLLKFSYKAPGGEEKPLYLVPNEVAGMVVKLGGV